MRLEHHLVGGYVRYISPHIIIIIITNQLPHVRVPRTAMGLYLFTVCAQCRMPSRL